MTEENVDIKARVGEPYVIIASKDANYVARAVNDKIAEGYRPLGGLSMSVITDKYEARLVFAQAVIDPERYPASGGANG